MYNTNNMEESNYMMPFQMSNYMYMPRTIDPIVEDLSSLEVNKEEKEYREKKKKNKDKGYKDKDYDDYKDKDYYDKDYYDKDYDKDYKDRDVERICRMIERYNPGILRTMVRYGVPYPVARRLCERIVRLTLRYYYD